MRRPTRHVLVPALALLAAHILASCTGSTTKATVAPGGPTLPDPAIAAPTHTISGRASAGPMADAQVSVYATDEVGRLGAKLGTAATDAAGVFTVDIVSAADAAVTVVVEGGHYREEASGAAISPTTPLRLVAVAGAAANVGVTPLTELATRRALATVTVAGSFLQAVVNAHYAVAQATGLADITQAPADPQQPIGDPNSQGAKYALVLAGLSQLAATQGVSSVELTGALGETFAQSGSLDPAPGAPATSIVRADGTTATLPATAWSQGLPAAVTTFLQVRGAEVGLTLQSLTTITATPALIAPTVAPPAPPSLTGLSLSDAQGGSVVAGTSDVLTAMGVFSDGSQRDLSQAVAWTSNSPDIATIDPNGLVTTRVGGNATFTATAGSLSATFVLVVQPAQLTELAVVASAGDTMAKGTANQLAVTGHFSNGTDQVVTDDVVWTTDDAAVAEVAHGGAIVTHGPGAAALTATLGSVHATFGLTVTAAALTALQPTTDTGGTVLAAGTSAALHAAGTFSDGSTQPSLAGVAWSSSAPSVATVNAATGVVYAAAVGQVTITGALGGTSGSLSLTVTAAAPSGIAVTASEAAPIPAGTANQLTVTATFTDGSTQNVTAQATYLPADATLATVTPSGLVQSHVAGAVNIDITYSGQHAVYQQAIAPAALTGLAVTSAGATQVPKGTSQALVATATYSDGYTAVVTPQVAWASSDASLATVDASGTATAVALGQPTITATLQGRVASLQLDVTAAVLAQLALTAPGGYGFTVPVGASTAVTATGTYSDNTTADLTAAVSWSVSDNTLATVDAAGLVTAVAVGQPTVTATLNGITAGQAVDVTAAALTAVTLTEANNFVLSIAAGTTTITATGHYTDGTTADVSASATWTSSDPAVATVDSATGVVTAVGTDTQSADITAAVGGTTATHTLTLAP